MGLTPTHLKIDVEGAETTVLRGARRTLGNVRPPVVFLELHNYVFQREGRDPLQCLDLLACLGYRFRTSEGAPITIQQATRPELIRLAAQRDD